MGLEDSAHPTRQETAPTSALSFFPPDYFAARDRFRAAAGRLGWAAHALPLDIPGEPLTIDAAVSPGGGPALVLSVGVHGVEGPFGSAVMLAALDEWTRTPPGVRVVLLHAVNPFGYAHHRRFDRDNIDLNRNFLLAGEDYTGAPPLYAKLDPFLNPQRPPSRWEPFTAKALASIARYGMPALKQAVAGGQYEFPRGLFFGGRGPSASQLLLRDPFPAWLAGAARVIHLDFHSGLGEWGTYKLLMDAPIDPDRYARAGRFFGTNAVEPSSTDGVAYRTRGAFLPWCAERAGTGDYTGLCAEFGTFRNIAVLSAVRAENQASHWGRPADVARTRQQLRDVFCPPSLEWRERVVAAALRVVRQALAGLRG